MPETLLIESVRFKRKKTSEWEAGVMFNGDMLIVDAQAKAVVGPIYNWERTHRLLVEVDMTVPKGK